MTITIVGQDPGVAKKCTCRKCGAILEYHQVDVRVLYQGKDYSGGDAGSKGFNCPRCNSEVITESW